MMTDIIPIYLKLLNFLVIETGARKSVKAPRGGIAPRLFNYRGVGFCRKNHVLSIFSISWQTESNPDIDRWPELSFMGRSSPMSEGEVYYKSATWTVRGFWLSVETFWLNILSKGTENQKNKFLRYLFFHRFKVLNRMSGTIL